MKDVLQTWESTLAHILRDVYHLPDADLPDRPFGTLTTDPRFGHLTTGLPFKLAKVLRKPPKKIAEELRDRLAGFPDSKEIRVEGPGYVNAILTPEYFARNAHQILGEDRNFGKTAFGRGVKILMEYVSANPTGPLHIAHGRQAAVGDSLANILSAAGYAVTREFYVNDVGNQIDNLGHSILWRMHEAQGKPYPVDPANFYHGDYVMEFANELKQQYGEAFLSDPDALNKAKTHGKNRLLERIKKDLQTFRVSFDSWYSQEALERSGEVERLLEFFRSWGQTYEKDGAVWLRTAEFGDTDDKVLIKRDGALTYRTPDLAYHRDKYDRGFNALINLWGPDHHAHIATMRAGLKSLNLNIVSLADSLAHREPQGTPETQPRGFEVLIIQHCRLLRGGQEVKMSKRAGSYETLRDLIDEVGCDAARYFFVMRKAETHLDFDLDLAKKQSADNPVYYVQYAHARIASIFRKGREQGQVPSSMPAAIPPALLGDDETALIMAAAAFPLAIEDAARKLDTQGITNYLYDLAGRFQTYYQRGDKDHALRVLCDDEPARLARLQVCRTVQIVLRNGLALLGVSAPDRLERQDEQPVADNH